jgi:aminopeptidase N
VRATLDYAGAGGFAWDLAPEFSLGAVTLDGKPVAAAASAGAAGERVYRVALPQRPARHRIEIAYSGTLRALDGGLDHRGVLGGLPAMAGAQGSFLPAGYAWYPRPGDTFRYALNIRTPAGQRAVAPGRLVSETVAAEGNSARFEFEQAAEGIDLMVGPYRVEERSMRLPTGEAVRLRTWFHEPLAGLSADYLDAAQRYVERHSREIGAYPYGEFGIVSSPLPTGFGMPGLTYLGIEVLKLPFIRDTSLGHEILHNWWGNGVYIDASRGNWAEGLTTFMADYAYKQDRGGEAAAREMRQGWLRDYAALAPGSEKPLAAFASRTHAASSAIGYGKSAMLFYMLSQEIGAEAFRDGIRDFWQRQRFRHASFDDLRASFERAAGRSLQAFFAQWLERTGAPRPAVTAARALREGTGWRLELDLEQGQPAYALRLPLRVETAAGRSDHLVRLTSQAETLVLPLAERPVALRLDPEFTLWRRLSPEESPPLIREIEAAAAPRVLVLGEGVERALAAAAGRLLARLSDGKPATASEAELADSSSPAILIGPSGEIDRAIARLGLPGRPAALPGAPVEVWVARRANGAAVLFVSLPEQPAAAEQALDMLARRLPHLSAASWVAFDQGKIVGRGTWPGEAPKITVR